MPWISDSEKAIFFKFLEPNPPLNRRSNRKVTHISFYSSEMKSVSTLINGLNITNQGTLDLSTVPHQRYANTLSNLDLLKNSNVVGLTESGINLLASGLSGLDADEFIFQSLMDKLKYANFINEGSEIFFKNLLRDLQTFYNSIPETEISAVLNDDELLYFLQIIFSVGDEIKRFYRLSSTDRDQCRTTWNEHLTDMPSLEPSDFFEKTVYMYMQTVKLPTPSIQRDIRFRVQGILKAYHNYILSHPDDIPIFDSHNNIIRKEISMPETPFEVDNSKYILDFTSDPIDEPYQLIVNGCPGSGKSQHVKKKSEEKTNEVVRVTFHPETTYYDFVGNYKPSPIYEATRQSFIDSSNQAIKQGKPYIDYTFVPGPFLEAYLKSKLNPDTNIILIIEEINRAKAASVFGDIFQLLDRNDRGESEYVINPNTDLKKFLMKHLSEDTMCLPKNLFIWATMNSADQGVMPLDAAFKRRWEFEYLGFRTKCEYVNQSIVYGSTTYEWESFREKINFFLLEKHIHEDKLIGPYFLSEKELADPKKVLNKLFLYLWEDVLRFNHHELMNFKSFHDLEINWNAGQGRPLNINFD
jgi:hypothetical protein